MGQHTDDLDTPITKTATGVVILPRDHHVMERKLKPNKVQARIGKSACDQCRYCTEYCPRFLLGYHVEPHAVMRSLAFTATGADYWNQFAALCCSCGLCTLYACPEELYPKEACDDSKAEMRRQQMKWTGPLTVKPHGMRDGRHVPIKTLTRKAARGAIRPARAALLGEIIEPNHLVLPLKQSAGTRVPGEGEDRRPRRPPARSSANPRRTRWAPSCTRHSPVGFEKSPNNKLCWNDRVTEAHDGTEA